jgi:signal transduction histidine kinase
MLNKIPFFKTDYRLITGYAISFILLLTSYLITLYSNKELQQQTKSVTHTHKVISDVENLLSSVKDGETGLRGYIATKDTIFLEPYKKSLDATSNIFSIIQSETLDSDLQQKKLKELKLLIDKKYFVIQDAITYFNQHNKIFDAVLLQKSYVGKTVMDTIRTIVVEVQNHEKTLLITRSKAVDSRYAALNTIVITSLILAFIFAAFGIITFIQENKARKIADKKVLAYQGELTKQIDELDNANKELISMRREEKFAATGRIARIIAHEVRNPLTNIDLAIAQIKDEVNSENDDIDFLFDMVKRNSYRINQLITELLNATRFTDLSYEKISINNLLDQALELAKDRINLNNILVKKDYSTDFCDILVDVVKIKIALLNLIINAVEALENTNNPVLAIFTKSSNNKCIVQISDNGNGMNEEELGKLFEPYFTTKSKGNGLGLTNTQNIILNHRGNISVTSKLGEGTKFSIEFDIAK